MRRSYLKIGDKSSSGGIVTEGIPQTSHCGTELTFIGAQVTCPACKSVGNIVAKGPRWPGSMMGLEPALEGDVCVCECSPPPVMLPSQSDMYVTFESQQLESISYGPAGNYLATDPTSEHWIRFSLTDAGSCEGLRCRAYFADGSVEEGVFDGDNKVHFDRPNASTCQRVDVVLDGGETSSQSVMGNILMAMVG
ncbi:PAAR domain-containing protein [Burkholderia vietnamiensis]|uniref:PAAR domain-containing protein n=1 Tax=Burkholderia vietnamiensis TaxID=60552 RepID=UPI001CAB0EF7|nr:PAAR domain-containing protein [Burkholderia vietnamiensis]CAG9204596.1 PAAR domain-containing protein [Burkholderia vietnamiensis]